jgi:hypothetical protein
MAKPIARRVEVAGIRPATFKLVDRGDGLFDLYRASRKIGNAKSGDGRWAGQFWTSGEMWRVATDSPDELLALVGEFQLLTEAREAAARPVEEQSPDLRLKARPTAEEKLSVAWAKRLQKTRLAELDALIAACRERIAPAAAGGQ